MGVRVLARMEKLIQIEGKIPRIIVKMESLCNLV